MGVIFYILPMIDLLLPAIGLTFGFSLLSPTVEFLGLLLLLVASVIPKKNEDDTLGSMWPLVGYDNAIDAIFIRGQWIVRMMEMDEKDANNNITSAMMSIFP